jgi:signal transduction histidine kinase/CheY-like chemotaxis protein
MLTDFWHSLKDEIYFQVTAENLRIRTDQIRARLRLYPVMIISQLLLEPMFVMMFWDHAEHTQLLWWLTCIYSIHAVDMLLWARYRERVNTIQECKRWRRIFDLFTSLTALCWGMMALWFFPPDLAFQALMICLALGLVAGAVTLDSVYPPALYIYIAGVTVPLLARLIQAGDETHWILASMLLLFIFGSLSAGRELSLTFWNSLRQRYENDSLIQQLTEQKAIAETASRDKSSFLASASHDLRQPLQALVLFSEALQTSTQEDATAQLAAQIGQSVSALVDMFDELLDISKFDAGVVQAVNQHFLLQTVMERLFAEFQPQAEAKRLVLEMPPTKLVAYSDPHLLERILRNLISNAIRYTDFGTVQVKYAAENGQLKLEVTDTGIGIRADSLPHIFEEYYQVDNQQRDRLKGLGLGLAIVRRMEALLNCHVSVSSKPALGSTFSFSIPQGNVAQLERTTTPVRAQHDLRGITVALVDDNREIRDTASKLLQHWGCEVFAGELPEQVLGLLKSAELQPDIFICDYRLPQTLTAIDGIMLLRQKWSEHIPVLVLTGDTAPQTLQNIKSSGAFLLHKPISPARLRSIMHFALHHKNADSTSIPG